MDAPRILLTGADGFLGRALTQRLLRDGTAVTAVTAQASRTRARLGPEVEVVPPETVGARRWDAVVHLAGADPHLGAPREAAPDPGPGLLVALAPLFAAPAPPALVTLAPASGSQGLGRAAEAAGARSVRLDPGLVLGAGGGILRPLLSGFLRDLGLRPLGSAPFPWVHLHDLLEALVGAARDPAWSGEYPLLAPDPRRIGDLGPALARATGRPARVPLPTAALAVMLGPGRRQLRDRTLRLVRSLPGGFAFRYPTLEAAVAQVADPGRRPGIAPAGGRRAPDGRRARWRLTQTTRVPAPPAQVFGFFSEAGNLGLITPAWTDFRILAQGRPLGVGARIRYRLRLGPFPVAWLTRIAVWEPGRRFVDDQARGPYRLWWHEHRFQEEASGVRMEDEVLYTVPFGPLGRLVHRPFIVPALEAIFAYRAEAIALRFGGEAVGGAGGVRHGAGGRSGGRQT